MNHIILSIQPQWLAKILNGEKTVEIRKSVPKLPCTAWLYCTKAKPLLGYDVTPYSSGWFTANNEDWFTDVPRGFENGKIVAKFVLEDYAKFNFTCGQLSVSCANHEQYIKALYFLNEDSTRLSIEQLEKYVGKKWGYAWHISNLVILDKPMQLVDFYTIRKNEDDGEVDAWVTWKAPVKKAPQSWQYVIPKGE